MNTTEKSDKINNSNNRSYYIDTFKFVRDLVHGYVYLTKFDFKLIDTIQFQRLKDIRQLTCQNVYPEAHHTRFDHSLGVLELTRQAVKSINENGFIPNSHIGHKQILDEQLQFNASIAALLHDVGHCPYSHLGESEFDGSTIQSKLIDKARNCEKLFTVTYDGKKEKCSLLIEFDKADEGKKKVPGANHEKMSCLMILTKYYDLLCSVENDYENNPQTETSERLSVDFELVIRSILGIPYDVSTPNEELFEENSKKNIVVNLINSRAFDMDRLDYIMRDSLFTGIGAPRIDTNRLFRNMYINNDKEYKIVFTNRAVPALQNMIEARDGLYMYVYNHHTVVLSDFMLSYIFRRLTHNERDLIESVNEITKDIPDGSSEKIATSSTGAQDKPANKTVEANSKSRVGDLGISFGCVSSKDLFSISSIIDGNRSDSDIISLMNSLHTNMHEMIEKAEEYNMLSACKTDHKCAKEKTRTEEDEEHPYIVDYLELLKSHLNMNDKEFSRLKKAKALELRKEAEHAVSNMTRTCKLIDNYKNRVFLKPWWKTNSEFNSFINTNFKDDDIRNKLCEWICNEQNGSVECKEFRSQIAKNVIAITQHLSKDEVKRFIPNMGGLYKSLSDGEFFVIQRSARFFDPETIGALGIAMKNNEILGSPKDVIYKTGDYYVKQLTKVIPQRDYYTMYAKNSFYVFSRRLSEDEGTAEERSRHYRAIEQIFIFVAKTLIREGSRAFNNNYSSKDNKEEKAHKKMCDEYLKAQR